MVKRTYRNFLLTMEIFQNQCYMSAREAERKARQLILWHEMCKEEKTNECI